MDSARHDAHREDGYSTPLPNRAATRATPFIYCAVFALMVAVAFSDYLFGSRIFVFTDIGSDTTNQYFAYYVHLTNEIAAGTFSIWNFDFGLGVDLSMVQAWTMDPFTWLNVAAGLLLGAGALKTSVLIAHLLKIALVVILFDRYLKLFDIAPSGRILFSLLYGFNGYLMLWGQHYFFGTAVLYFTLLLCVLERCVRTPTWKNHIGIALIVFLLVMFSIYIAFMALAFSVLYVLFRLAYELPVFTARSFLRRAAPFLISFAVGLCLAGISLVPTAIGIMTESGRFDDQDPFIVRCAEAFGNFRSGEKWLVLSRLVSNNLVFDSQVAPATSILGKTNYYEFPQVLVTFSFLLLIPQLYVWLFKEVESRRRRALVVIASLLIFAYFVNDFPSLALYAFTMVSYRSTFVFIPLLCLALAIVWDRVVVPGKTNAAALLMGLVASLLVIGATMEYSRSQDLVLPFHLGAFMAVGVIAEFALLLLARMAGTQRVGKACLIVAAAVMLCAAAFDGYVTNCNRQTWLGESEAFQGDSYGTDSTAAVEFIQGADDSYYRIEKTYYDISSTGDSLYQNYSGVSSYNSTLPSGLRAMYERLWPQISEEDGVYQRYWMAPDNPELATLLGIKYVVSKIPLGFDWLSEAGQVGDCRIYRNTLASSIGTKAYKALTPEQFDSARNEGDHLLDDYVILEESDVHREAFDDIASITPQEREDVLFQNDDIFYRGPGSSLFGTCTMDADGYLVLAIPHLPGWSVSVDGKPVDVHSADFGLCCVELNAGTHDIFARYEMAHLGSGALVSLCGLAALLAWLAFLLWTEKAARHCEPASHFG